MKRLISVILVLMTIFLIGCSSAQSTVDETETVPEVNKGVVELDGLNDYELIFTQIKGDTLYALATEKSDAEYGGETEIEILSSYYLIKTDFTTQSIEKVDVTDYMSLDGYCGMNVNDDGSLYVYDDFAKKATHFDSAFRYVSDEKYQPIDIYSEAKKNPVVDDTFNIRDFGAIYSVRNNPGVSYDIMTFNDDYSSVYLSGINYEECLSNYGKIIFGCNYIDGNNLKIGVYDYNSNVCINTTTIQCESSNLYLSVSPINAAIGENYAFVNAMYYYGEEDRIENHCYYWEYGIAPENTELEIEKYDEDGLRELNNTISKEITDDYGIDINIDESPDDSVVPLLVDETAQENIEQGTELGAQPVKTYNILIQLQDFLSRFPTDFVKEMFSDFVQDYNKHTGLDIYIVKEIYGNTAAFANGWEERMIITFATDEFLYSHLPHEFMHIIDMRIFDYYESIDKSFWEEWEKYNPKDFCYGTNDVLEDDLLPYFVTAYSLTSQQEERADMFDLLFCDQYVKDTPPWLAEYPHIQDKVNYLCKAIREAYPSLKNADTQPWEKWITD